MIGWVQIWIQYITVRYILRQARRKGYARYETGVLYLPVESKLFANGYAQYKEGKYITPERYYWTTSPVKSTRRTKNEPN